MVSDISWEAGLLEKGTAHDSQIIVGNIGLGMYRLRLNEGRKGDSHKWQISSMVINLKRWDIRTEKLSLHNILCLTQNNAFVFVSILTLIIMLLVGCAVAPVENETQLVWPAPPLSPRIQFVRSVVGEEDLKKDTTFSQQVMDFLTGVKPPPKRIVEPMGVAVSDDGQQLYVANSRGYVFAFDFENDVFKKIAPLDRPIGLVLDGEGFLHVVEQGKRQITVFDPTGVKIRSYTHPDIERPTGIAIDRTRSRVYVADTGGGKEEDGTTTGHSVKVFSLDGELVETIGRGKGQEPGQMLFPTYLALDSKGNLYVTDTLNARVQVFDPEGDYIKSIGQRGSAWGMFDKPKGVALDSFGNVYVVDSGWSNVQIFNQKGQVLLFFGGRGPLPGMLKNPTSIAIDAENRIYVADFINHRVNIYQLVNTTAADSKIQQRNVN